MDSDREVGCFQGHQYKFKIYQNNVKNFYGDVSDDRSQNTMLVKTDHSADRYMFESLKPELGILLKFSYWWINAEQFPIELGAIYIPVTIQDACFIVLIVDGLARQIIEVIVVLLLNNLTPPARSIKKATNMGLIEVVV